VPSRHHSPLLGRAVVAFGLALVVSATGLVVGVTGARSAGKPAAFIRTTARPLSSAANSATFTDPNGDGALDVTTVLVANDDEPNIHIDVNLGTALQTSTDEIVVYLDTDNNPSSGGQSAGAEYYVDWYFPDSSLQLAKWTGSGNDYSAVAAPTLKGVFSANHVAIDIHASDLGNITSFNFWVGAWRSGTEVDRAPDSASWAYQIKVGPPSPPPPPPQERLKVKLFKKSPWPPRAGESFLVTLDVVDAATGKPVYAGVKCAGKLAGRSFPGTDFARRGESFCIWDVPESAAGKFLGGSIQVFGGGGSSVKRSFGATVVQPPRRLDIYHVSPSPSNPKSGSVFYTAFRVQILESGASVRQFDPSGRGTCRGTIGSQTEHIVTSEWYGKGWLCEWQIPAGTQGQTFVASVQVTWHGLKASKAVRYTIH
jgi:hypothetical protein